MSPVATVYVFTGILSVVVAVILVQATRLSLQAKMRAEEARRIKEAMVRTPEVGDTGSLKKVLLEQINDYVSTPLQAQKIANRVSLLLDQELASKVSSTEQQLRDKYDAIIREKTKNEEVAWNQYDKVLSDKKDTEAVIRSVAEGLVVVDSKGKIMMMNPAAEKLLGVSQKDKVGRLINEDIKDEQFVTLLSGDSGKKDKEVEISSRQAQTRKIVRSSTAVIEDAEGKTVGMVAVLSDITKQKELDALKDKFVMSVSHELRTPLIAIDKSLSLILSKATGPINEDQEKFLEIAERNLKRLTQLINDILDLSKFEAGKLELRRKFTAIGQVVNESAQTLQQWAQSKSVNIVTNIQDGIPQVNIDPDKITQVLLNLIGNALKFTPAAGTITVSAVLEAAKKQVVVSVSDTGVGITKENLPKVFDKFYQVKERMATDISGTGLGLSIAKEIVELHGGKIWVESEQAKGTAFSFYLMVT